VLLTQAVDRTGRTPLGDLSLEQTTPAPHHTRRGELQRPPVGCLAPDHF
jgi:hypothetical protein